MIVRKYLQSTFSDIARRKPTEAPWTPTLHDLVHSPSVTITTESFVSWSLGFSYSHDGRIILVSLVMR